MTDGRRRSTFQKFTHVRGMVEGTPTPGKAAIMPLHLTICRVCTRNRPEMLRAVNQLATSYPKEIEIIELDCMAACDDIPAIMIETSYYAHVAPQELINRIREMLKVYR